MKCPETVAKTLQWTAQITAALVLLREKRLSEEHAPIKTLGFLRFTSQVGIRTRKGKASS